MPFPEKPLLNPDGVYCGFRASELLGLRLSDIDLAGRQLYIRRLKNGFSTSITPLLPDRYNVLKSWLRARKYLEGLTELAVPVATTRHPLSEQQFLRIQIEAGAVGG